MLTLATSYLAGSILTLVIPCGLFIAIAIWHTAVAKRAAGRAGEEPPAAVVRAPDPPRES